MTFRASRPMETLALFHRKVGEGDLYAYLGEDFFDGFRTVEEVQYFFEKMFAARCKEEATFCYFRSTYIDVFSSATGRNVGALLVEEDGGVRVYASNDVADGKAW